MQTRLLIDSTQIVQKVENYQNKLIGLILLLE